MLRESEKKKRGWRFEVSKGEAKERFLKRERERGGGVYGMGEKREKGRKVKEEVEMRCSNKKDLRKCKDLNKTDGTKREYRK